MNDGVSPQSRTSSTKRSQGRADLKLGGGRFVLKSKLGGGSFGDIYKGLDTWRNKDVAIKLEQTKTRHPQLSYESKVYKLLHQSSHEVVGIPEVHYFGVEGDFNVMVMDLLGPCVEDLFMYCLRKFSLKTVLMLADQFMYRIEYVHNKGMIHRDIKPENFTLGVLDRGHHLYIIDFGLSKRYWDGRAKSHIPFKTGKPLTGTARYCSANTHRGYEQSRRDDLESIGFLLVYLMLGQLPWQGIPAPDPQTKTIKIGERKMQIPPEELCKDCIPQMLLYLNYCRGLKFEQTPDYKMLRAMFREAAEANNIVTDWVFDWILKREQEVAPQEDDPLFENMSMASHSTTGAMMGAETPGTGVLDGAKAPSEQAQMLDPDNTDEPRINVTPAGP